MQCNHCGSEEVFMAVNLKISLPADMFRKLPRNFSTKMDQCWVDWESVSMQCKNCGRFFPLMPKHEWQTSVEDLVFENKTGRIAPNNHLQRDQKSAG